MRYRVLVSAVLLFTPLSAPAVTPQFWENFTQEEMLKGTLNGVSLSSDGRLSLAPAYDMVFDTGQPYIFSMVRDNSGNIFAGTGHEGKVYRIDKQGKGSIYFSSEELDVFAMALDGNGTLYVGTSPDGKIYKVTGPKQATDFCKLEDKYIWSMLFDGDGNLFVGTGPRGIVYKIDKAGKQTTYYDADDNHIRALAMDSAGNLLAGTSPGGLLIEISSEGKGFALLDTPMEEIHSLVLDRYGTIHAVASNAKPPSASTSKREAETKAADLSALLPTTTATISTEDASSSGNTVTVPGSGKDSSGERSAIFAITKDGSVETVYESKEQMVYDIIVRDDGSILAVTGPKGRILSIDVAKQVTVVTDSPEEQMTCMSAAGDIVWVAGSNQGKVYKLSSRDAQTGTFESRPLDAKMVASWGKISWRAAKPAGGIIELSTRTGNTEQPDASWSAWSPAYTDASGQQIPNPRARFLQWRASFKKAEGASSNGNAVDFLERVQIPYLQQNMRPEVVSITVLPFGLALQKMPSLPAGTVSTTTTVSEGVPLNMPRDRGRDRQPLPPRQMLQPGAQSFTWKAVDDNDDDLEYSIFFKGEGETEWKQLVKGYTDTFFTLDAASLPDGVYRLKVVASDAPSNPIGKFLIGELVSKPFMISNSTPVLEVTDNKINGKKVEAQFRARVPAGRIVSAEFSVDGGEWHLIFPLDGIADSAEENYQLVTPDLASGEHVIGIRSSDASANTGSAKILVQIP